MLPTGRTTRAGESGEAASRLCRKPASPFERPRAAPSAHLLNAQAEGYVLDTDPL
jgi:hypothetical protein